LVDLGEARIAVSKDKEANEVVVFARPRPTSAQALQYDGSHRIDHTNTVTWIMERFVICDDMNLPNSMNRRNEKNLLW
jgi:hypothetical protein